MVSVKTSSRYRLASLFRSPFATVAPSTHTDPFRALSPPLPPPGYTHTDAQLKRSPSPSSGLHCRRLWHHDRLPSHRRCAPGCAYICTICTMRAFLLVVCSPAAPGLDCNHFAPWPSPHHYPCCATAPGRHPQHHRRRLLHQGQVSHRGHAGEWPSRGRCRDGSGRAGGGSGRAGTGRTDQGLEGSLVACVPSERRRAATARRAPNPHTHTHTRGGGSGIQSVPVSWGVFALEFIREQSKPSPKNHEHALFRSFKRWDEHTQDPCSIRYLDIDAGPVVYC
jgi:hypothetical protein